MVHTKFLSVNKSHHSLGVCIQTARILRVLIVHLSVEGALSKLLNILKILQRAFGGRSLTKNRVYVETVLNLIIESVLNLIIKNSLNGVIFNFSVDITQGASMISVTLIYLRDLMLVRIRIFASRIFESCAASLQSWN